MKQRIRVQGTLIFLALVSSILLSKFLFPRWAKAGRDEFLDILGMSMVLLGFLLRIAARGYKKENSAGGHNLIMEGPYRLSRNPMYLGTLIIGTGIIALIFTLWALPLFISIFLLVYIPQINREERELSQRFVDTYINYCQRTPKFFPRLNSLLKFNPREYFSIKWPWIKNELLPLIMTICFLLAAEAWEDARLFGEQQVVKELLEFALIIISFSVFYTALSKRASAR